ncbi:hypothetical protein [Janthinobacterium sp. B9-8]|uniref:hypothetical protein n=1 Tax=Janthinobacterium sp. B9-8 TaxID=1236179 RepID=UPI00061D0EDB|nr:hypothetical protein [Janthinobacterium sp. B9-8]AMC34453.1 hypothetical protein VN23_07485 [Janthinobacterium sp. B9-8]
MKTNRLLLASGLIAAFTAALHTIAGTPEIQAPLLGSAMPQPVSLLLYACWHLVTVTLILSALALIWSARPSSRASAGALPRFVSLLWLLFGLVFVVVALVFAGPSTLLLLPQWVLLIPVGILGLLGDRKRIVSAVPQ